MEGVPWKAQKLCEGEWSLANTRVACRQLQQVGYWLQLTANFTVNIHRRGKLSYGPNCTGEEERLVDCRNRSLISGDESCTGHVIIGCWNISTDNRQPPATAVMMPSRDSSPAQLVSSTKTILTSSHIYIQRWSNILHITTAGSFTPPTWN